MHEIAGDRERFLSEGLRKKEPEDFIKHHERTGRLLLCECFVTGLKSWLILCSNLKDQDQNGGKLEIKILYKMSPIENRVCEIF